ncbi:hypothetical protein F5141DRAFT_1290279 [Pisolithus sp. B1]|nr:hypothetical protein F5141DRAFT_1290279 [Pisolithus sp. B1]
MAAHSSALRGGTRNDTYKKYTSKDGIDVATGAPYSDCSHVSESSSLSMAVDYLIRQCDDDLEHSCKKKKPSLLVLSLPPSSCEVEKMALIGKLQYIPSPGWIKATAAAAGVELEEPVYKHYEDDEMPEFPTKFPCGRIPAFEGADGFNLTEGATIARKAIHAALAESQLRGFSTPEAILLIRTYLVDEHLTLADITVASVILLSVLYTLDAPLRNRYPNVLRHLDLIIDQPKLKDVFGQPTFVEKAVQYTPSAKEKKEKEPKQPVGAPAPKKEKPKKAEEDENPVPEEPKPKYPLHLPPKSTFNLEDRKRTYSDKNARGPGGSRVFLRELRQRRFLNFYRVDFKYNDEVTIVFMSSNQISGFFNRLEASRKYLFGSVGSTRAANDSIIAGVLILRVKMSKPVIKIASNYESNDYKKLDMENSEDKAFFELL